MVEHGRCRGEEEEDGEERESERMVLITAIPVHVPEIRLVTFHFRLTATHVLHVK